MFLRAIAAGADVWQNVSVMRIRRHIAVVLAPSIVLAWSCATEPALEPRADVDPSIPEIDASWSPRPKSPVLEVDASGDEEPRVLVDAAAPEPPPQVAPVQRAAAGEIAITEVMYDPLGEEPASEWLEVHNETTAARSLAGLTIHDGADRTHTVAGDVVIAAGAYVVLARDREAALLDGVPASAIAYVYGAGQSAAQGVLLANGASGAVRIFDGTTELTNCAYGGYRFTDASGRSVQLVTSATYDAGSGAASTGRWCSATPTPGAANACAAPR